MRTAQTPGSVSWIGWSANLRATARISSWETVALGGVGALQEASSLAADLGVTTTSPAGSGAIARARRIPPPEPRAVAGAREGSPRVAGRNGRARAVGGEGNWRVGDRNPGRVGERRQGDGLWRESGGPADFARGPGYKSWGFARVMAGSAGPLDGDRAGCRVRNRTGCGVSRKEPR